jgi:hypothetical protein
LFDPSDEVVFWGVAEAGREASGDEGAGGAVEIARGEEAEIGGVIDEP